MQGSTPEANEKKKKSAFEGKRYEDAVRACLLRAGLQVPETAGSSNRPDVTVVLPGGGRVCIELKNRRACEGGQRSLKVSGDHLEIDGEILWEGKVPAFLCGDTSVDKWQAEKASFKGRYFPRDVHAVGTFYREKGSAYIQVQGKGLYHTGEDPLGLGVPRFAADTKLRVRCKQFGRTSIPSAVMTSLVFARKTLAPSTLDLETMPESALLCSFTRCSP